MPLEFIWFLKDYWSDRTTIFGEADPYPYRLTVGADQNHRMPAGTKWGIKTAPLINAEAEL